MNHGSRALQRGGLLAAVVLVVFAATARGGDPLFPFVLPWDDASPGVTNPHTWGQVPAQATERVVVRDGHLVLGAKRFRILGVNTCFGASFPTKEDAPKVAARMARLGINAVRFHHMDTSPSPNGLLKSDARTLDPAQLDRLDYFIAQLKANGIYADLNLHVGRNYPGLPQGKGVPNYDKGLDQFEPRMIALQRDYARDLLTHTNPYTHSRYADEPAVVLVEINNENALTHEWYHTGLDDLPDVYGAEFARQWNAWLKTKYADTTALRKAWSVLEERPGPELLTNGGFTKNKDHWNLEQHQGAVAEATVVRDAPANRAAVRLHVSKPGLESWHVQLNQAGLKMTAERPYTLKFQARSESPTRLQVVASQAHENWEQLWSSSVELTAQWQSFQLTFAPTSSDTNARIVFSGMGAKTGTFEFADVSLTTGGLLGLKHDETLGQIDWFRKRDFASRTPEAQRDWLRFLFDTEKQYWGGLAALLKEGSGRQGPPRRHPAWLESRADPGRARCRGLALVLAAPPLPEPSVGPRGLDRPEHSDGRRQGRRHPARARPAARGRQAVHLHRVQPRGSQHLRQRDGAADLRLCGAQDWDGVFLFAYSHRRDQWDTGSITSFFDIDQDPRKCATLPAAFAMFVRGDIPAASATQYARPSLDQYLDAERTKGPSPAPTPSACPIPRPSRTGSAR